MAVHDETRTVVGLSKPTTVAVWRSGDIVGLGFLAALGLRQSGSGAQLFEALKVQRSNDQGWAISRNQAVWQSSGLALGDLGTW